MDAVPVGSNRESERRGMLRFALSWCALVLLREKGAHRYNRYIASGLRSQCPISSSNSNPSIPGIFMSNNTESRRTFYQL